MLEQILSQGNMERAFKRVTANKGAAGVDGVETTELGEVLAEQWPRIKTQILGGSYIPQPVRRVEIDKPGGGVRPLGIPTTTDRLIQQAIGQVLSPIYEPVFSEYSYGFRPGRSAHDGVQQALSYINQGYNWIVDMDLKSFFDKVNHDYLMHLVSQRINDKPLLIVIAGY